MVTPRRLLIVLLGCATSACAESKSPTAPCTIAATLSANSFGPEGGGVSLRITTRVECTWSLSTDPWIVPERRAGNGPATIALTISPNPDGAARTGGISVNGQTVPVQQSAMACEYRINPIEILAMPSGHRGDVSIETASTCAWTLALTESWVTLRTPATGTGTATVGFDVAATPLTSSERRAQISVQGAGGAGRHAEVRQLSRCDPWRCNWTAQPDVAWVTVSWPRYPALQGGDGGIRFVVEPNNTGVERRGEIATADTALTIIQAAR